MRSLGYDYADVTYEDNVTTLYDYSQRGGNVTFTHRLSERTQLSLLANSSRFDVPAIEPSAIGRNVPYLTALKDVRTLSTTSKTNNLQIGIDYAFSETLKGGLSAGIRKTSSENIKEECNSGTLPPILINGVLYTTCLTVSNRTETTEDRGTTYTANLGKNFAASRLSVRVERAIDPSGSGTLVKGIP